MARLIKRQGDVLIVEVSAIPPHATPVPRDSRGRIVLAVGEHKGMAHVVEGDAVLLEDPNNPDMRFLPVGRNGATVTVGEATVHRPIQLPPRDFQVIRQVEVIEPPPARDTSLPRFASWASAPTESQQPATQARTVPVSD